MSADQKSLQEWIFLGAALSPSVVQDFGLCVAFVANKGFG